MTVYYADASVTVYHGDCLDVLRELDDASVDAVVTDPPYGLEFMGKEWDRFSTGRGEKYAAGGAMTHTDFKKLGNLPSYVNRPAKRCAHCGKQAWSGSPCKCAEPEWVMDNSPLHSFQAWCQLWATECLRVLKPGGHLLAFGGTRTSHRLTCAIEDAGFEIRDSIAWLYGCLSDDTEILTADGWVRYDKATEGQHALALDPDTGGVEWQPIQHVHRYWHDGDMVRLHSDDTDQLLTPNHRVVLDSDGRLPHVPQGVDAGDVCSVRSQVLEAERLAETDEGALLFAGMQRGQARSSMGDLRPPGECSTDSRELPVGSDEDDRRGQPRLEGRRYRVQEARELCRSQVCASAGMGAADGAQRRLHHGAPATNGGPLRVSDDPSGGRQPREPRPEGQPSREPDAVAVEQGSQALRVEPDGSGSLLPSTRVEATRVGYAGVVWCITVGTGAFIARRNGLIFATGNSGFPKSLDVSKAIDKAAGAEREVLSEGAAVKRMIPGADQNATGSWIKDNGREFMPTVTAPATDDARTWQGWGTALKPAWENVVSARKPLADKDFHARIGSWLAQAADPTTPTGAAVASLGLTDTSASEPEGETSSNTVTSWSNCWAELSEATSTSTTETTSGTIIDLRTLWSCLSQLTHPSITLDPTSPDGRQSLVELVDNLFAAAVLNSRATQTLTATASVTNETPPTSPAGGALSQIVVARKPLSGTVAATVLAHGTGALNIDGCRVGDVGGGTHCTNRDKDSACMGHGNAGRSTSGETFHGAETTAPAGRWPANVVLDESQAAALDAMSGELTSGANPTRRGSDKFRDAYGDFAGQEACEAARGADTGGASRYFTVVSSTLDEWQQPGGESTRDASTSVGKTAASSEENSLTDGSGNRSTDPSQMGTTSTTETTTHSTTTSPTSNSSPPKLTGTTTDAPENITAQSTAWNSDAALDAALTAHSRSSQSDEQAPTTDTASTAAANTSASGEQLTESTLTPTCAPIDALDSRFAYTAKASSAERVRIGGTAHATVKPLSLMRWLVRLVTPPGGVVLEPFAGSGTTVEAAILEGFRCIAIEREAEYLPLITQRIHRRRDPAAFVKAAGGDGGLFDLFDVDGGAP